MKQIVEMPLEDKTTIPIEVDDEPTGGQALASAGGKVVKKLERTFDDAIDSAKSCASTLVRKLGDLVVKPQEIQVEFGLKVNFEGNMLVASGGAEASFKVASKWKPGDGEE